MLTKINFPDLKKTFGFGIHNQIKEDDSWILPLIWEFYTHNNIEVHKEEFNTTCDYNYVNCKYCYQEEINFRNNKRKVIYKDGKEQEDEKYFVVYVDHQVSKCHNRSKEINPIRDEDKDEKVIQDINYPYYKIISPSRKTRTPEYVLPDRLKSNIDKSIIKDSKKYSELTEDNKQIFEFLLFMDLTEKVRDGKYIIIANQFELKDAICSLVKNQIFPIAQTFMVS